MPKVGILSDTHGWVDPQFAELFADADLILHGGDIGSVSVLDELTEIASVRAVRGNIDGGPLGYLPEEDVVEIGGLRIGLLHIAGNPRRPKPAARRMIRDDSLDLFICGHSHIPVVGRVEGCLWLNPGAAGRHGFHTERYALQLRIEVDSTYQLDRIHLGARSRHGVSS